MSHDTPQFSIRPTPAATDAPSFRGLVDNLPVGVFRISTRGRIIYVNPYLANLVAGQDRPAVDTALTLFFAPLTETDGSAAVFTRALAKNGVIRGFEYEAVSVGPARWFSLNARVSQQRPDGESIIDGTLMDITRFKQVERQRVQDQMMYRLITDNTLDMIWQMDLDLKFIYINSASVRFIGYPPDQVIGRRLPEFCSDREMQKMSAVILHEIEHRQTHTGVLFETRLRHHDGHEVPVEVHGKLLFNDAGDVIGLHGATRDISERKRLEEQLHQAQRMEAIGRLAGGVAHDFNNLLSIILGYSEAELADDSDKDVDRSALMEIYSAADRAKNLTRQLLAFSRKQVLEIIDVDLNQVIAGFEKLLRRVIGEDIQFRFLPSDEPLVIKADISQIEQVLMNLAVNARDAMPGGGALTIFTETAGPDDTAGLPQHGPGYARIHMADTGTGMDSSTLTRIFEPFYTTKDKDQGTGLGLATTYGIVSQHGGHIRVDSSPGRGSRFTIDLPISDAPAAPTPAPDEQAVFAPGSATVLVVEDDEAVRRLICRILAESGYEVIESRSVGDAVVLAQRHPGSIDMLITDVVMPGMTGPVVYEKIATLRPGIRVLYISGYTDSIIAKHGLRKKGIQLLNKPFSRQALLGKMQRVLKASQSHLQPELE